MADSIKISAIDTAAQQPICGVCKTQFSRYTCPHCNLHYCSLPCFRSPLHAACSESFDRQSLVEDIRAASDKTPEEKRAMMDMLKKFEEESLELEEGGESGEEEGEGEGKGDEERMALEERLEGLDLDSLSPEDVLALLSPAQREAFQQTLADPAKVSALVAQEFQEDPPWWTIPKREEEDGEEEEKEEDLPPIVASEELPVLKVGADGKVVGHQLVYNLVAVLFAYAYTLRTFSLSSFSSLRPDSTERTTAIDMISQLVPFLVEKSTVVLQDVGGAVEYVVAREKLDTLSPKLLVLLLSDLETILRPHPVSVLSTPTLASHASSTTLHAFSDLHNLFSPPSSSLPSVPSLPQPLIKRPQSTTPQRPRKALVQAAQKLLFYAAIVGAPGENEVLGVVARTVGEEGRRREREGAVDEGGIEERKVRWMEGEGKREGGEGGEEGGELGGGMAKIVEIG